VLCGNAVFTAESAETAEKLKGLDVISAFSAWSAVRLFSPLRAQRKGKVFL
jgi:hypothetical protein